MATRVSDAPVVVQILRGVLHIEAPRGFHRLSLLGALTIPVAAIESVEVSDKPVTAVRGWRTGIGMPDLRMGTWRHDGEKDYVAVDVALRGLVITLRDQKYARLIVSVDDPESIQAQILRAQTDSAGS